MDIQSSTFIDPHLPPASDNKTADHPSGSINSDQKYKNLTGSPICRNCFVQPEHQAETEAKTLQPLLAFHSNYMPLTLDNIKEMVPRLKEEKEVESIQEVLEKNTYTGPELIPVYKIKLIKDEKIVLSHYIKDDRKIYDRVLKRMFNDGTKRRKNENFFYQKRIEELYDEQEKIQGKYKGYKGEAVAPYPYIRSIRSRRKNPSPLTPEDKNRMVNIHSEIMKLEEEANVIIEDGEEIGVIGKNPADELHDQFISAVLSRGVTGIMNLDDQESFSIRHHKNYQDHVTVISKIELEGAFEDECKRETYNIYIGECVFKDKKIPFMDFENWKKGNIMGASVLIPYGCKKIAAIISVLFLGKKPYIYCKQGWERSPEMMVYNWIYRIVRDRMIGIESNKNLFDMLYNVMITRQARLRGDELFSRFVTAAEEKNLPIFGR